MRGFHADAPRMRYSLFALLLAACFVGEASGPPQPPPLAAGHRDLYGINAAADGVGSDVVADLGAAWVRLELVDYSTGTALGADAAARLDATLADYHDRGIAVLLIVDYATLGGNPGFGYGIACAGWSSWRAAWLARLGYVAQQFGSRVDAWEIWNEPDQPMLGCNSGDYNPGMPADTYGRLLRDAAATLRDGGATGTIVVGGLDSGLVQYVYDASAAAGGLAADAIAIHPYGVVPDASWCPDSGEDLNCEWGTLGGKADEYAAASGLPVWVTEFGVKSTDTQHQARYVRDAYAAFAAHAVERAFVFCESDAMVAPFGMTYANHAPKPNVYAAYQTLARGAADGGDAPEHTGYLHGTVHAGTKRLAGLRVTAWGHDEGDFHETTTDALGIYAFTDLAPSSLYNLVINAQFVDGEFVVEDGAHDFAVRDNVELIAGPDGWHGEDFPLAY
jgi:polysaccharide biosynthesis protein PslG